MWTIAALMAVEAQAVSLPAWMAGCWEMRSGDKWTEECWSAPRGGMMIGYGRSGTGGALDFWEVMHIEMVETDDPAIDPLTFHGAPRGEKRTAFAWDRSAGPGVAFVNTGHDFPQRISYRREGETLVATVSMIDGTRAESWRYRRAN